jgi:hypothetical protein
MKHVRGPWIYIGCIGFRMIDCREEAPVIGKMGIL